MENQSITNPSNISTTDQISVNHLPTPPQTKTNLMVIVLLTFLISGIIFGFGGYYIGKQASVFNNQMSSSEFTKINETGPTPVQNSDECSSEKDNILSVITNFETFQKNKDANGVLALFTPPQLEDETSDYQNLNGKDADISPRLYNNVSTSFNTQSYKITQQPTKSVDSCIVLVDEQRSYYGGPANPQYLPVKTESVALTMTRQNGEWKIDQYQSQDLKVKKSKYSGFLMEYAN